jgi:hypothetical protein
MSVCLWRKQEAECVAFIKMFLRFSQHTDSFLIQTMNPDRRRTVPNRALSLAKELMWIPLVTAEFISH